MFTSLPLSKLVASPRNPRRVKPEREAHRRLVASIRVHGLLEPLVVRPHGKDQYWVVAGRRRLDALREVHRGQNPKVPCQIKKVDDTTADAISLSENFVREAMHPLDEAEAFAMLAQTDGKGVDAIAAEFGVSAGYVRQRMKLATLAEPIRTAYRSNQIDTATAEAFAAVPADRQIEIWKEIGGRPQHAQHVHNLIEHAWIDAAHAVFDVKSLPEGTVSSDLFNERVLVERKAFMAAQAEALAAERTALTESGWTEVVVGLQGDVQDRLWSMDPAPPEYDKPTARKLERIAQRRQKLEAQSDDAPDEEADSAIQDKIEALNKEEAALTQGVAATFAEPTKAAGTAFLVLDPDGRVRREYRVPKPHGRTSGVPGSNGSPGAMAEGSSPSATPPIPTSDDLGDQQTGTVFTHEALAVRDAVRNDERTRRVVLAIILHEKVLKEAVSIRHGTNATDLHVSQPEGFTSTALQVLRDRRVALDPLRESHAVDEVKAFEALSAMPKAKLEALIDLLTVGCLSAHLNQPTPLIQLLAQRLGIDLRRFWRPDATWLGGYKKIQLAHLIGQLLGPVHGSAAEQRKKSELVADLAKLFTDAAEKRIDDPDLAAKVNAWLPSNLRLKAADSVPAK